MPAYPSRTRYGMQPCHALILSHYGSISECARRIAVARRMLDYVVRGTHRPRPDVVVKLTHVLGRPATELFTAEVLSQPHRLGRRYA